MNATDATGVQSERMNVRRGIPEVSCAMVALEQEIKVEPVLRELVKVRARSASMCTVIRLGKPARPSSASTRLLRGKTRRSSASANAQHWRSPMR